MENAQQVNRNNHSAYDQRKKSDPRLTAFYDLYNTLSPDTAGTAMLRRHLEAVYAEHIEFSDPIHRVTGLDEMERYFEGLYENITYIEFNFHNALVNGDEGAVHWTMIYRHPRLKGGKKDIRVEGVSLLRWRDGKITRHQDIFDAGSLLYEHLPILGSVIRKLKERMA